MSIGVINPTIEGLTSKKVINMIFGNVVNPQANPTSSYYLPGGRSSYPPPRGLPFGGPYPIARGKTLARNYFNYVQMPQTNFRQLVMPQPAIGMPYPRLNTIWNPSQE